MKKIIIGDKLESKKEGFYVTIKYMHGDADGYSNETYYFEDNDASKEALILFDDMLKKCEKAFSDGMAGYDQYIDVVDEVGYWVESEYGSSKSKYINVCPETYCSKEVFDVISEIDFNIETDTTSLDGDAKILRHSIIYSNGASDYEVIIK